MQRDQAVRQELATGEATSRTAGRQGSLLRRGLQAGLLLFARLLRRASPRLNDLLLEITKSAYKFQQQNILAPREITMHVGETQFRLCVVGGHEIAHSDYVPLAARGEVYEPVATACWERNSGVAAYLEQGRLAYVPVTRRTRQFLLFDRPLDVLILGSKLPDLTPLLGRSVEISTAVG